MVIGDYFDRSEIAFQNGWQQGRHEGERLGRRAGQEEGLQAGYQKGVADGLAEGERRGLTAGYERGWNEAIARAQQEVAQQLAFTREQVADKQVLQAQLEAQQQQINRLLERVRELEAAETEVHASQQWQAQQAAQAERMTELQQELQNAQDKLTQRNKEHAEHLWHQNRIMVVLNAARKTLESLSAQGQVSEQAISQMFVAHYSEQIRAALGNQSVRTPLEQDQVFADALPKTHAFLVRMLGGAAA
ncbi:hypothetical protein [Undibacterium squillarum]|uniref:Flagellar assembly protein FliH n=1 Tax=Undibacterium squillarum TaxID=1131567 RepID=A0ABQ2XZX4_9BURK|nr:hypothetical protein [Undibacterium squillarum]GGX47243.1 hypothetical protein GCM10010946_27140 [Undibacterium squillarum]